MLPAWWGYFSVAAAEKACLKLLWIRRERNSKLSLRDMTWVEMGSRGTDPYSWIQIEIMKLNISVSDHLAYILSPLIPAISLSRVTVWPRCISQTTCQWVNMSATSSAMQQLCEVADAQSRYEWRLVEACLITRPLFSAVASICGEDWGAQTPFIRPSFSPSFTLPSP